MDLELLLSFRNFEKKQKENNVNHKVLVENSTGVVIHGVADDSSPVVFIQRAAWRKARSTRLGSKGKDWEIMSSFLAFSVPIVPSAFTSRRAARCMKATDNKSDFVAVLTEKGTLASPNLFVFKY